ncbi:MAG TPA: transglycosylase SLT domain-containing protein [Alphaproteobacteria bacterium]
MTKAIRNASAQTGVDFNYLVQQAKVESGMNPTAKARTSSATGLYQFIEQTWLRVMKQHGAEHGYGNLSDKIHQKSNGQYAVADRGARASILNMRKDPKVASLMAAELATDNHDYLQSTVGIEPNQTDLYMAHFLGAGGASNFLKSMKKNPWAPAASIFPEAARANRGVFYAQGRPLSLQQVYNRFEAKFDGNSDTPVIQTAKVENMIDTQSNNRVTLADADDWSAPGARHAHRFSTQNRTAGSADTYYTPVTYSRYKGPLMQNGQYAAQEAAIQAIAPQQDSINRISDNRIPGRLLSSPVDVMFINQSMRMQHNDDDRYNA